jgi:hypothetical protein
MRTPLTAAWAATTPKENHYKSIFHATVSVPQAKRPKILNMAYTDRKSVEARPVTESLRLQIERRVNEGGADGEDTTPHVSERIERDRKP